MTLQELNFPSTLLNLEPYSEKKISRYNSPKITAEGPAIIIHPEVPDRAKEYLLNLLDTNRDVLVQQLNQIINQLDAQRASLPFTFEKLLENLVSLRDQAANNESFDLKSLHNFLDNEGRELLRYLGGPIQDLIDDIMAGTVLTTKLLEPHYDPTDWSDRIILQELTRRNITNVFTGNKKEKVRRPSLKKFFATLVAGLPVVAMALSCTPNGGTTNPETTPKPTPGGVTAATIENPTVTPETTVTPTAKPTETKEEEITGEKFRILESFLISEPLAKTIEKAMQSPTGKDESTTPVNLPLNKVLIGQENTAFSKLLRRENNALWTKITSMLGADLILNADGTLSFQFDPSIPNAEIYLYLAENTDPSTNQDSPYIATLEMRTIAHDGDSFPNNSALDIKIPSQENGLSKIQFAVVAPVYTGTKTIEAAYTFQLTTENIQTLVKLGVTIPEGATPGKVVIMDLPPAVAIAAGVDPQVTRPLNGEILNAEAERMLNQDVVEKLIEESQLIAEVNTEIYPELKEKFGSMVFYLNISDLLPGTDYSTEVYDPERMFLFTASNLWLHCINTQQCDPNLSLEEFIANPPAQDWHVINTQTQKLEMFTGLNIKEVRLIIHHHEDKVDSEIKYQYSSGTKKDYKISVQYNPDNPEELIVIGQLPEIIFSQAKHNPGTLNVDIPLTIMPRMTLPHNTGGDEADTTGNELLSSLPGKPYQTTRDLYYGKPDEGIGLALRIFNDQDPNP